MLTRTPVIEGADARPTTVLKIVDKRFTMEGVAADDGYFGWLVEHGDGNADPNYERVCRMFIGPDDTCIDIGANIGMTALMMSRFGKRVVALEGGPAVAAVLARNCDCESKIQTEHCAVADYDGEASFFERSAWGGMNRAEGSHEARNSITVPVKRLATILDEHGVDRMDFLKIDVEGSEWPILRDSIDLINQHQTLVYFEFSIVAQLFHRQCDPMKFAEWITGAFSHIYIVRYDGTTFPRVPSGIDGARVILQELPHCDILATNAPHRLVGRLWDIESQAAETYRARLELSELRAWANQTFTRLQDENASLRRAITSETVTRLQEENTSLRRENQAFKESRSWRLTAPLRWLGKLR